ncbi:hypothetical protein PGTUg99_012476 [Puccinia graminis f. sp. tritici]|uniref:Uncharacterized protein n=1 Tax=Puccinia graminis f. sp. tritici TaxID=56615 RepID=A0A5B0NBI6_PUCGR|nr:hypothetical protein PGTUg99_012476 [Puccinia graminis f. sp. tritici]
MYVFAVQNFGRVPACLCKTRHRSCFNQCDHDHSKLSINIKHDLRYLSTYAQPQLQGVWYLGV